MPDDYGNDTHKDRAQVWFAQLRDELCNALETLELDVEGPNPSSEGEASTFKRKSWERQASDGASNNGGGGVMSILRGRVFEKAGVNVSTVWGEFSEEFRKNVPGAANDPR